MLVYGKNVLKEIDLKHIKKAYCSRKDYLDFLKDNGIRFEFVDNKRLDSMVRGNHQGIILDIFEYEYKGLNDIKGDFIVILDHLEDPHNLGSIIRTCACKGIKSIIIPKDRCALVNETVMKVSEGTLDKVDVIMVTNINNAINKLKDMGYFIYAADMNGTDYKELDTTGKKALVIGNEGSGVSKLVKESSDYLISIKMSNGVDSLNASVAAGILIFGMKD